MLIALADRSDHDSPFQIVLFSNKPMFAAICLTFTVQLGAVYPPYLCGLFRTVPLPANDLFLSVLLSTWGFWVMELRKLVSRTAMAASDAVPS